MAYKIYNKDVDEVIFNITASDANYVKVHQTVHQMRQMEGIGGLMRGQDVVVFAGELSPKHENIVRKYANLPLIEEPEQTNTEPKAQNQKQDKPRKARKSNYGRWEMLNNFIDLAQTEFTLAQRIVWLTMFRKADGKTNKLETSVRNIAKLTGTSDTTVQAAITELIKKGWLVRPFSSPTRGTPSLFRVQDGSR